MDNSNEPNLEHYENLKTNDFTALNPKINISSISFVGLKRTNENFLKDALEDAIPNNSTDLFELSQNLNKAFQKLERLNIFKDVSVTIDHADTEEKIVPGSSDTDIPDVKIIFNCKEKRFNIRTGTEFQRKDMAWVLIKIVYPLNLIILEFRWTIL